MIRVLLVDDHAVVREGLRLMLGSATDIEVAGEAENPHQALRQIREHPFDVVILDIAMPEGNGLDLLKQIHAEFPKLAVLVLSMYSEEIYAVRSLKLGAGGYLTKNASPSVLIEAVRKLASGGKYVNPSLLETLASELGGGKSTRMGHEALSNRELEVLRRLANGETLVQIAQAMHVSPKTVTSYRARIVEKLGVHSNAEIVRYAMEHRLVE